MRPGEKVELYEKQEFYISQGWALGFGCSAIHATPDKLGEIRIVYHAKKDGHIIECPKEGFTNVQAALEHCFEAIENHHDNRI